MTDLHLHGVNASIALPMTRRAQPDFPALRDYVGWVVDQGADALTVNADTGEGAHLSLEERTEVISTVKDVAGETVPVVSGLIAAHTAQAVEYGRELLDAGADGLLVFSIPAFAGQPLPDELVYRYYAAIAELGSPAIAFSLTRELGGALLGPELLTKLINDELIVAVKDASFDPVTFVDTRNAVRAAARPAAVLSGCDNFIYESFVLGADGCLLGFAGLAPGLTREVLDLVRAGDYATAEQINRERMQPLAEAMFAQPLRNNRARLKESLIALGVIGNATVRPPLLPLTSDDRSQMLDAVKRAGLIEVGTHEVL
ncbi:dihydrodipicolinate synthase family protein [Saccharopolyspora hattusasensis]|uniref:dihydrodipicolinate synthase family protein n=1 Tax=Saccharopolyspora hattusasensis TaxID=1128679 RepID=UPI003D9601DF